MPDEPEIEEKDPVSAIREALTRALSSLKKLMGQEEEELQEEMKELEGNASSGQAAAKPVDDKQDDKASE
jgi:Sec-independent protein translocase protein TatA